MHRQHLVTAGVTAISLVVPTVSLSTSYADSSAPQSAQVVLDWERVAFNTIYPATPIPVGVPILGFTSMAMYDAARTSLHSGRSSEPAAVASAAHDVLSHYVPAAQATLDVALTDSLGAVPDGRAEANGVRIGRAAAAAMIASRVGDGFGDPSIHYTLPAGIGVWQPESPATDMLAAWLGSLRPLVVHHLVHVNGPDALTSAAYARDYNQVKALGSLDSTRRTQAQTDTALFFNSNSATMVGDAVVRYLEANPIGLRRTARMFAAMHAAMTDSVITCWQLKRDVGLWRPWQAIAGAETDGNPATSTEPGWEPLLAKPPYSDYVSGHACLTGPALVVTRRMLGEDTPLELQSVNFPTMPRTYTHLREIRRDAFRARIWGGLHFRDAMQDGYRVAGRTARRVLHTLG
jgi:hypothetical protein